MNVETWGLITRIIAIISIGTLVGQASARLFGLIKKPFFQILASVLECSALLASLLVTLSMIAVASGKFDGERLENSVGTLQDALYLDLEYMARSAALLGMVVAMFYLVTDGAPRWRTALVLVAGSVGAFWLFAYLSGIAAMFVIVLDLDPAQARVVNALIAVFQLAGPVVVVLVALLRLTAVRTRVQSGLQRIHVPFASQWGAPEAAPGAAVGGAVDSGSHRSKHRAAR
ncbi:MULTISPECIES: hypothetical protein [Tsukamurella]|uniref:Uncharacterized protein n=2 Tax=Tsukamurella TaxID=2060 RepID=A0A5C5S3M3_9ACTN|nr:MULTISPECIES: hypothetical protein [Tsukamurella]NMD56971.1 hypothetical protein [Tsukamurella columbiensis]TWS29869.1 hypothetical protein FK530_04865 [Tsukamurella conjunctivitidis]